jgi:hypothetical protein
VVAGRDEHRRAAAHAEGVHREGERVGVHVVEVEEVARHQDGMRAALDRLAHEQVERAALVAAPVGTLVRRQPAEGAAEMKIGDLQESDDGHALGLLPGARRRCIRGGGTGCGQPIRKDAPGQRSGFGWRFRNRPG